MADSTEKEQKIQTGVLNHINNELKTQNGLLSNSDQNIEELNKRSEALGVAAGKSTRAMRMLLQKIAKQGKDQDSSRKKEAAEEKKKTKGEKFKLPAAVSKGIAPLMAVFDAIGTLLLMIGVLKVIKFFTNTKFFADTLTLINENIKQTTESFKRIGEIFSNEDYNIWEKLYYSVIEFLDNIVNFTPAIESFKKGWNDAVNKPAHELSIGIFDGLKDGLLGFLGEVFTSPLALALGAFLIPKVIGLIGEGLSKIPVVGGIFGKGASGGGGLFGGIGSLAKTLLIGALAVGAAAGALVLVAMAAGKMKDNKITPNDMKMLGIALTGLSMIVTVLGFAFERIKYTAVAKGLVAVGGMVAAMNFLGPALTKFKDVDFGAVVKGIGVLALLAAGIIGLGTVLMNPKVGIAALLGLLAIGAVIGVIHAAAHAFGKLAVSMKKLEVLDWKNLMGVGAAVGAISAAIAGLGAGNLIGSALNGLNRLFGGSSPMEKLVDFAKSAPLLERISKVGDRFGSAARSLAEGLRLIIDQVNRLDDVDEDVLQQIVRMTEASAETAKAQAAKTIGNLTGLSQERRAQVIESLSIGSRQTGGPIKKTGMYNLHQDEIVLDNKATDKFLAAAKMLSVNDLQRASSMSMSQQPVVISSNANNVNTNNVSTSDMNVMPLESSLYSAFKG